MEFPVILFIATFSCLIIQLIYYWIFLTKPYRYQTSVEKETIYSKNIQPPVSIILYVKQNAQDLENYLPSVLEQKYPLFEVIIVNNNPTDDIEDVLKRFSLRYKHLYHTYIPDGSKYLSRKKLGLTVGIKASQYNYLLFTEPDCQPASPYWLCNMARHFSDKKAIVFGFSVLQTWPSQYIAYDYFFSNLQMIVSAIDKQPYVGDGKNLGYSKIYFSEQKSISGISLPNAGENDFFINKMAAKENVAVELSPESLMHGHIDNFQTWKIMKEERAFTQKFFWRLEKWSRLLFYIGWILTMILSIPDWILFGSTLLLFFIRLSTQFIIINNMAKILNYIKFTFTLPFFDFIQLFVDGYFYLYKIFRSQKRSPLKA
jgi:glycosyltransferase involved in cell wall biosynthesis